MIFLESNTYNNSIFNIKIPCFSHKIKQQIVKTTTERAVLCKRNTTEYSYYKTIWSTKCLWTFKHQSKLDFDLFYNLIGSSTRLVQSCTYNNFSQLRVLNKVAIHSRRKCCSLPISFKYSFCVCEALLLFTWLRYRMTELDGDKENKYFFLSQQTLKHLCTCT